MWKDSNKFIDPFGLEIDDPFKIFYSRKIISYRGRTFTGTADEFFEKATKVYKDIDTKGYMKIPSTKDILYKDMLPAEALDKLKELHSNGEIPCK